MSTIGHEVSIKQDQIDARRKEHILSLAMGEAITWGTTGAIFGATTVAGK
jgi:hypothetical protein